MDIIEEDDQELRDQRDTDIHTIQGNKFHLGGCANLDKYPVRSAVPSDIYIYQKPYRISHFLK